MSSILAVLNIEQVIRTSKIIHLTWLKAVFLLVGLDLGKVKRWRLFWSSCLGFTTISHNLGLFVGYGLRDESKHIDPMLSLFGVQSSQFEDLALGVNQKRGRVLLRLRDDRVLGKKNNKSETLVQT